jgi:hypothetical protein
LPKVNVHRFGDAARTFAEVSHARRTPGTGHQIDPVKRLNGAQQDSGTNPGHLTCDIQQERCPIREIHISVSSLEKERAIAPRLSMEGMSGCVTDRIGFRFDDAPA